ncbi:hypothetical protein P168DRAFT_328453 [Aspergillus campestris IBT 28561]|uniref:Uncharacterized protein n=1 Tax=Aspergillus campestris (strain IBT 28561) TaxID=1392248 RepID=A0A2I1D0M8_ASPC2|nr:uncharacterized protein P168DRAFT_328453 [Aspergillus campestris IBT 28561]PKY03431.1 hypothetical protein P168DRAFT_328453 [Aspergillus campestris IBT 28561]
MRVVSWWIPPPPVPWGAFLDPEAARQGPVRQILDASNNRFVKATPYIIRYQAGPGQERCGSLPPGGRQSLDCGINDGLGAISPHAPSPDTPGCPYRFPAHAPRRRNYQRIAEYP